MVYFSSAWRVSSAFGSSTFCPPRTALMAVSILSEVIFKVLKILPSGPLSSQAANTNSSLEIYLSLRFCAYLSHKLIKDIVLFDSCTSPPTPSTLNSFSISWESLVLSSSALTPACANNARTLEPLCFNKAYIKCTGSIN